jgi:signal peptidase I
VLPQPEESIERIESPDARTVALETLVRRATLRRKLRHARALAIEALALAGLLLLCFVRVPQVDGHSMAPQIDAGDHVIINTVAYALRVARPGSDLALAELNLRPVLRGDVIAFSHGDGDARRIYLKRVIGLPGESVSIERGVVKVGDSVLPEPYAPARDGTDMRPVTVPQDSLFVLGDNRGDSDDSRSFGPVPLASVVGKAAFVVWPPARARAIH